MYPYLFAVLAAALFQLGHCHRVILIDDLALELQRVGQHKIDQRVEIAGEPVVLRFEAALRSTDVLDAVDDACFAGRLLLGEDNRSRNLFVDNVYQAYDNYGKYDLDDSFCHF